MIRVERMKVEPPSQDSIVDEAVRRALLDAKVLNLSAGELARLKRDTVAEVNRQLRYARGPNREEARRLRQIKQGTLKGPVVSTEARYAASGLVPGTSLRTVAQPGEMEGEDPWTAS